MDVPRNLSATTESRYLIVIFKAPNNNHYFTLQF